MRVERQQDYVLRTVEERGVRFVQMWFTDVLGTPKSFQITPADGPLLADMIMAAHAVADEAGVAGLPGSGGVLVTGSVITAGDARKLLGPNGGELPPEPPVSQPSRHSFTAAELS